MAKGIEIRWKAGTAKGYTDVFGIKEFETAVSGVERLHLVLGPHGGQHIARYRLKVNGAVAWLDYKAFAPFNRRQGMELGIMQLRFATASRTKVVQVYWDGRSVPDTEAAVKHCESVPSIADVVTSAQKALAKQRLRPGQAVFRQHLDLTYGARCCVSGCPVAWAVDGAHIKPYADKASNHVSNGLLLRSDLHVLFDAHQLAIDPDSKMVHFSPEAQEWAEYRSLHRKQYLLKPQPGHEDDAPPASAFRSRWRIFCSRRGNK